MFITSRSTNTISLHVIHILCRVYSFFLPSSADPLHLHSFPTRRSSDLTRARQTAEIVAEPHRVPVLIDPDLRDRKSTRLNSSHLGISYAVFCLKKKKNSRSNAEDGIKHKQMCYPAKNKRTQRPVQLRDN